MARRKSQRLLQAGALAASSSAAKNRRRRTTSGSQFGAVDQHELLNAQLRDLGLQVKDIEGDGNCLFRALADQVDGHAKNHLQYRREVCDYLSTHREHFQGFISDEDNRRASFDHHLEQMRQGGTYGGNMELVAFARMRGLDIWVHQAGRPVFCISGMTEDEQKHQDQRRTSMTLRPRRHVLHVAYHDYEHYSSIRPLGGPLDGIPHIRIHVVSPSAEDYDQAYGRAMELMKRTSSTVNGGADGQDSLHDLASDVEKLIMRSTGCADLTRIRALMMERRGHVDDVIERLIEEMNPPSPSGVEGAPGYEPEKHASPQKAHPVANGTVDSSLDEADTKDISRPITRSSSANSLSPPKAARKLSARERKEEAKKKRKREKQSREKEVAKSGAATLGSPASASQGVAAKLSVLRI